MTPEGLDRRDHHQTDGDRSGDNGGLAFRGQPECFFPPHPPALSRHKDIVGMLREVAMQSRVRLFGIDVDPLSKKEAIARIREWLADGNQCRYVVTPNLDHVVRLQDNLDFREAYRNASLVLVDGKPVLLAARMLGKPVPETVPGSDLTVELLSSSREPVRVFLLGAAPGVAERAAQRIREQWPMIAVDGHYSPPFGFERDPQETERILALIRDGKPDLLIVGLGAPKQELWVSRNRQHIAAKVVLCVGASIDFLAGEKTRAPVWMRKACLEWLFRMLQEPKRLVRRYAFDAWRFPSILLREMRQRGVTQ